MALWHDGMMTYIEGLPVPLTFVMQCSPTNTYFLINNTYALPFSPSAYVAAGTPLPSYVTNLCCASVINGCGVPYSASQITSSGLSTPALSALPGQPAIQWSSISSPYTISGLLQVHQNIYYSYILNPKSWNIVEYRKINVNLLF